MYTDPLRPVFKCYEILNATEDGRVALDALGRTIADIDRLLPEEEAADLLPHMTIDFVRRYAANRSASGRPSSARPLMVSAEGICCNPDLPGLKRLGNPVSPCEEIGPAVTMNQ